MSLISELVKVQSLDECSSILTEARGDAQNRSRRRPLSRSRLKSRQKLYLITDGITSTTEESYTPSWINGTMSITDLNMRDVNDTSSQKSPREQQLSLDFFQSNPALQNNTKSVNPMCHNELEKEYLKLKKKMSVRSGTYSDISDKTKRNDAVESTKTPTWLETNNGNSVQTVPHSGIFDSDTLGMNHFKKHILNVKASSKRYKRVQQASEHKGNRRIKYKFKPLYERRITEDCLTNSSVEKR